MSPREPDINRVDELLQRVSEDGMEADMAAIEMLLSSSELRARRTALDVVSMIAKGNPDRLNGNLSMVVDCLEDEEFQIRRMAADILTDLNSSHYDELQSAVPQLIEGLDDEFAPVQRNMIEVLTSVGRQYPDVVASAAPRIAEFLNSDLPFVRILVVQFLAVISTAHPEAVIRSLPKLVSLVGEAYEEPKLSAEDRQTWARSEQTLRTIREQSRRGRVQYRTIQEMSALTIAELAKTSPSAVKEQVDKLTIYLNDSDPEVRAGIIDVFIVVGETDPEVPFEIRSSLVEILRDGEDSVTRGKAALALSVAAEYDAKSVIEAVEPAIGELLSLLDHENSHLRGAVTGLLSYVAEHRPETVEPATDTLIELLNDPNEEIRGSSAWTLGYLDAAVATKPLQTCARTDASDDVREIAEVAIKQINADRVGG